ncbi:hypothetical protein [Maridesulfovibrio sp.]
MKNETKTELEIIESMFASESPEEIRFIGHQVSAVDTMGHQLITMAGVLLAITVSILPVLREANTVPKIPIIIGSGFVMLSALINGMFVFRIKLITSIHQPFKCDLISCLRKKAITIRNYKFKDYHYALSFMMLGLVCYLITIIAALL